MEWTRTPLLKTSTYLSSAGKISAARLSAGEVALSSTASMSRARGSGPVPPNPQGSLGPEGAGTAPYHSAAGSMSRDRMPGFSLEGVGGCN